MSEPFPSPVRVIIPTTTGPVEVLYLGRENPAIGRSTVCLGGTSEAAGIDREYSGFVQSPTGVVERLFGHRTYRMDVSGRIDVGSSWQLGAVIAHALEAAGRLAQPLDQNERTATPKMLVWATGSVRTVDLAVGEVGHVAAKLATSLPLLEEAVGKGVACRILVPPGNLNDIDPAMRDVLARIGIVPEGISRLEDALDLLDLPPLRRAAAADAAGEANIPVWQGSPYPGLQAYDVEHRPVFFGRARAREECLEQLRRAAARGRAFLLVHGRSGIGKSSLVLAGLAGDTAEHAREGGSWRLAVVAPGALGADPFAALAEAIGDVLDLPRDGRKTLGDRLASDPSSACRDITEALRTGGRRNSLLLVLDQLEQALADVDRERNLMTERFGAAVEQLAACGSVWVVATMRTDLLELLEGSRALMRLARDERLYRLERPTLFELSEIVAQPAAMAGYRFDDDALPSQLAEIALGSQDSLPLLQLALARLVEMAGEGNLLTGSAYERIGGFEGVVTTLAEEAVDRLGIEGLAEEEEVDHVLVELVRMDPATGRVLARSAPLIGGGAGRRQVIEALLAARLISVDGPASSHTVRLTHEVVITAWPRLAMLVERLRADIALRDRLDEVAAFWEHGGRDAGDLLRGAARVSEAETFVADGLVPASEQVRALVEASRARLAVEEADARRLAEAEAERAKAETERERIARAAADERVRRQRLFLGFAAVAIVGFVGLSAALWHNWTGATAARQIADEARVEAEALSRELARSAGLLGAGLAAERAARGEIDEALLMLLEAAPAFTNTDVPAALLTHFDTVLDYAARSERVPIPPDTMALRHGSKLYFYTRSDGSVAHLTGTGAYEVLFTLPEPDNPPKAIREGIGEGRFLVMRRDGRLEDVHTVGEMRIDVLAQFPEILDMIVEPVFLDRTFGITADGLVYYLGYDGTDAFFLPPAIIHLYDYGTGASLSHPLSTDAIVAELESGLVIRDSAQEAWWIEAGAEGLDLVPYEIDTARLNELHLAECLADAGMSHAEALALGGFVGLAETISVRPRFCRRIGDILLVDFDAGPGDAARRQTLAVGDEAQPIDLASLLFYFDPQGPGADTYADRHMLQTDRHSDRLAMLFQEGGRVVLMRYDRLLGGGVPSVVVDTGHMVDAVEILADGRAAILDRARRVIDIRAFEDPRFTRGSGLIPEAFASPAPEPLLRRSCILSPLEEIGTELMLEDGRRIALARADDADAPNGARWSARITAADGTVADVALPASIAALYPECLVLSADSTRLAIVSRWRIEVHDLPRLLDAGALDETLVAAFDTAQLAANATLSSALDGSNEVRSVSFAPQSNDLIVTGIQDVQRWQWDAESGNWSGEALYSGSQWLEHAELDMFETRLAVWTESGVLLRDVANGLDRQHMAYSGAYEMIGFGTDHGLLASLDDARVSLREPALSELVSQVWAALSPHCLPPEQDPLSSPCRSGTQ